MSLQIAATLPSEQTALAEFLQQTFQAPVKLNSFEPDVLQWKYFSAHPDWPGPRSFVARKDNQIVAHAGVWPLCLRHGSQLLKAIHLIDWAAARSEPGAGVMLLRKLADMCDLLVTIGGSVETRAILPKIGYRECGRLNLQARVVRPSRQLRINSRGWKGPLRALRSVAWSLQPLPGVPAGWHASAVSQFDDLVVPLLATSGARSIASQHCAAGLNRFLSCPGAKFSAFMVSEAGRPRGHFLLSQIQDQTRIVDLRTESNDPECLASVCILAARKAAELHDTREIVAGFSNVLMQSYFARMGFRSRQVLPLLCYDRHKLCTDAPLIDLTMLDGDLCFMANLKQPYLI